MKRVLSLFSCILLLLMLPGCNKTPHNQYQRYSDSFFDTFDTMIQVVAYTKNEAEFQAYYERIHTRFQELHRLYDIYNNYPGINNVKTINDNAGIKPVQVAQEIIDLITFAKDWAGQTGGKTNIALGPVLKIWHDYRTTALDHPEKAELPPTEMLRTAAQYTDLDRVIIDRENSTVFLTDSKMSLDVGALAKGFATELVTQEIMAAGFTSGAINAGGNMRTIGKPLDGVRERWAIGIQNPDKSIIADDRLLDTIFVNDASIVSSGDYQRYYLVDGEIIHHLIDPQTLFPATHYQAVTIVTKDSRLADFLSTTAFLTPYPESREMIENLDGVDASGLCLPVILK
ncbi:MAG: FAD:protein FMN transferase [bacterium]|jgi:thiamine biosynthesis lipoprotein